MLSPILVHIMVRKIVEFQAKINHRNTGSRFTHSSNTIVLCLLHQQIQMSPNFESIHIGWSEKTNFSNGMHTLLFNILSFYNR